MKKRKILRERRKRFKILSAVVALVMAVTLAVGLLPDSTGQVFAAEASADGQTMSDYSLSLGSKTSTQYNGRVWTDKSVSTDDVTFSGDAGSSVTVPIGEGADASDFLVTYSALATSQRVSGESNVPVDVVFIADLSGSMSNNNSYMDNDQKRIQNLVTALNASINELMSMNPENRIGVVGYSSTATTILPLDHYTPNGNNQNIFSYSDRNTRLSWNARNSSNQQVSDNISVTGGTNTQMGIYQGMNMLATEDNTSATVGGEEMQRVPSVIVMADGAATYSSDSAQWWSPNNNNGDGPGDDSYYGNGMKAMMTASYMKQAINRNYEVEDVGSNYATKVYTIGIGTADLGGGDDENLANITLNPKDHWNDNNTMATSIRDAWNGVESGWPWGNREGYISNNGTGTPRIVVDRSWGSDVNYTLTHPSQYDIVDVGLQYNDAYYDAITAEDINTIFDDIVSSISISTPQVPTKVEGNDPVKSGYITYTDVIGDYMEVDSVKTLIWAGQQFNDPVVSGQGTENVTYTFNGEINNPAYENAQNANQIEITIHTDTAADGTKTQTMTVKIPASAIPLRVNTVQLGEDDQGQTIVESNKPNDAYPLRLVYGVSLQENIDTETLEGVSDEYIAANTDTNGKVNFYSNKYTGQTQGEGSNAKTVGDAKVEFTPADTNPFYFLQENTPIYMNQTGDQRVTQFSANGTYWVPVTYYDGTEIVNTRVERSGASMAEYIDYERSDTYPWQSYAYIRSGAPRLGNIEQFVRDKDVNTTDTAATSFYPTFEGEEVHDGKFVVYLGNNGKLQLDAPASLVIDKNVTADDGLTAPNRVFTFEITSASKAGQDVSAVKTTGTGGSAVTEEVTVNFNGQGVATVELTADQTIELKGMAGADYSIRETNIPDGFTLNDVAGADNESGSGNDTVASGEVTAGAEDEVVNFTNNYSVSSTTSDRLNIPLSGSKTITGRDFQQDDTFTFTIAAARATPDAPLPQKEDGQTVTSVTITPTSGTSEDFRFDGTITFTKPGEYRYIIRETQESLAGIDYDTAVFRLNIVIVDNGDGTMRLARVDEIDDLTRKEGMVDDGLDYTANPMVQEYYGGSMHDAEGNAVKFENNYDADAATASIQGTKVLNVRDSDYRLKDGDFLFDIEALGSTSVEQDSYDEDDFTADPTQPMPVDNQGQILRQTTNIANGDVQFEFARGAFTQDMVGKTFGYKITESLGNAPDTTVMDANMTRIVWITVGDDGQGHVTATVGPNDSQAGVPNNFTFTNSYEPTSTTIGDGDPDKAGITVQKTFNDHAWTSDYTFEYTIKNISAPDGVTAPMPTTENIEIGNPISGNVNTNVFGTMTFEQEGTYIYEITETDSGHDGVTYDDHIARVTVTVSEDESAGTLSSQVTYDNSTALNDTDKDVQNAAAFTNTYNATFDENTTVNLDGIKNLTVGRNSDRTLRQNTFFAEVTPLDGAPYGDNVINQGNSSYTVGNTADNEAENGTYSGAFSGLLKNVKYQLSDLDGAAFKNFVYLISEQQGSVPGVTYDKAVYQVTVTVTDDGNGKLSAGAPQIVKGFMQDDVFVADEDQDGVNGVVFNNSYEPSSSDPVVTTSLKKVLSGDRDPGLQAGEFEFKIELSEGDASGVILPDPSTVVNDADGNINFGNITFTKAGTYKIKATEVIPDDATDNGDGTYTLDHVTYDTHVVESTFIVTDTNGKLTATRTGTMGNTTFTNTYEPDEVTTTDDTSVNTNILVTKEVTGAPATEAFTFSLNLADGQDGSNVFEGTGDDKIAFDGVEVTTSDNIAAGARETKAFAGVTFTAAGDYRFVIDETTTTDKKGWTYDDNTVEITVHVVDQNGQLVITGINNNNQTFVNSYVPGSVTVGGDETGLRATKQVTGAPATEEFEFTLRLTSDNAANVQGLNENNSITKSTTGLTGKEDATETINFGDLTFSAEGIYTFTVTENNTTDADGWTYGTGSGAVITVTVTDEGHDGQLDATTIVEVNGEQVDTNNPTIVNSYDPGSVTIGDGEAAGPIQVTKNIEGTAPAAEDFSFTLTFTPDAEGNTGKAENIQGLTNNSLMTSVSRESLLEDNTETAAFGKLTFTEEGDYYFTVTENNQAAENSGWTYDNSPKTVIVHVTDTDHNGHLEASVDDDAAVITNSYVPGSVTVGGDETGLQVTKQVTGAPALSEFVFTLQLTSDNAANVEGLKEGNAITKSTTGLEGTEDRETVDFGELTFTAAGDYVFTVKEDTEKPVNADGWTYDNNPYTITVHVTDDNFDGQLDAEVTGNNPTVTNQYKANEVVIGGDSGNAGIAVQKTLIGRNWQEGDSFSFTLAAADGTPMPAEGEEIVTISNEDTEKTAEFGAITYTETGTYHYTVTEAGGNIGGVTYDKHIANVTVNVTDENYDGQLDAEVTYDNNTEGVYEDDADVTTIAAFTNTYEPGGTVQPGTGDAKAQLTKELVGRDWMEGDQFSFTITADEDTPAETLPAETTVTVGKPESGNSNTFDFGPFTFNAEGVYHYTVREEGAGTTVNGITYSNNVAHITIDVTDDLHGGFAASVTITNEKFINTYSAGLDYGAEGGLNLVKRLDGHDIAAGQFQFQVTPVSGDGYVSAEDAAKKAGIEESGLTVSTDAASMVDGVAVDSIALFNQMKFDQTDNGKTYAYQISEVQETKAGYQYDKTTYTVTISVSDDNNGVLTVTTVVSNGTDSTAYLYTSEDGQNTPAQVVFNNAYDGAGSLGGEGAVSIQADKELVNGQLSGNDFTFIVTDKNEAEVTRGTNDASGKITFNEVAYTTDKLIADLASGAASYDADSSTYAYQYEVTEDTSNFQDMGVIANVAHFNITVTVKDNGDGTLTTAVDYGQYGDGLTFQNTYGTGADIAVNVGGTKELAHADGLTPPDITGAYQFTISGQDENGNAAPLPENTTASNDANGNVSFGAIQYSMENVFGTTAGETASDDVAAGEDGIDTQIAQRTKTYTYTVTESGNVAGVTNDQEASKTFTIVVTDNGDGTLSVTDGAGNTVVPGAQFTFVNTYSVTPSTSTPTGDGGITITKNLEGRALNEGEFTFEMTGLAGTISEGMAVTGTNEAAGNVALGGLEFSRPGTYEFRISEVIPETPAGGVTYDGMTYQATAEVTDNHDGTLAVAWTVKAAADGEALEQVTFTNTYKAAPAGVQFGALKRLDGDARDLKAGEFTFQVKDESGKVVATAKNKADGSVRFDSITFDKAGTYTYTISEVKGSDETITYDETVYTAIVNVTDDLNGQLYASVTAEDGSALKMTFTNKYTKPAVPVEPDEGPTAVRTGDTAPILPIILVMAAALAAIIAAAAVILRRNRRQ